MPKGGNGPILIGEPVDTNVDVGAAVRLGQDVKVKVFSGSSVLNPGSPTDKVEVIDRVLSPLTQEEAGPIRCIGLNYKGHANEVGMALPDVPIIFLCVTGTWTFVISACFLMNSQQAAYVPGGPLARPNCDSEAHAQRRLC